MKDLTEELSILAELIRLARLYRRKTSEDVWIRVGWLNNDMTVFIYPEGKVGQSVSSAILTLRRLIYPKSGKERGKLEMTSIEDLVLAAASMGQETERCQIKGYDLKRGWHSEMYRRQHEVAQEKKMEILEEARRRDKLQG